MRRRAAAAGEIIGVDQLHYVCHFLNCPCFPTFRGPTRQSHVWFLLYVHFYRRREKSPLELEAQFNSHLQVAFHFALARLFRSQPRNTTRYTYFQDKNRGYIEYLLCGWTKENGDERRVPVVVLLDYGINSR